MPYAPLSPNYYDKSLVPAAVRKNYLTENLLSFNLAPFMGASPTDMIQVVYNQDGHGPSTNFTLLRELDYKVELTGYDQFSGKGAPIKLYTDKIDIDLKVGLVGLQGLQITKMMTPLGIYELAKPLLQRSHKRRILFQLLKAATTDIYPNTAAQTPTINRIAVAGRNGTIMAAQANINAYVAAQNTGAAYNQNGLSVAYIRQLRDMAVNGGRSFEQEKRISPIDIATHNNQVVPTYVYFMSTASYQALQQDPLWNQYYFRGTVESQYQPSGLVGGFAKGKIDDVLIYEVPELGNFQVTSDGVTSAWNLFCGAQAFGLVFNGMPWFDEERSNHGTNAEWAILELRGQKALMFPSYEDDSAAGPLVENGIIHSFVRVA